MYFAAADLVLDNSAIDRAHCDIMSASPDACLYVSILFCYLLKLWWISDDFLENSLIYQILLLVTMIHNKLELSWFKPYSWVEVNGINSMLQT